MLMRPSASPFIASLDSNPTPPSLTVQSFLRVIRKTAVRQVCFPFFQSSDRIFYTRSCLGDSQDEGAAGSTAAAAKIARVPARSIDLHAGATGGGDYSGRDRGLQLLAAGRKSGSVDHHYRRRNKLATIHSEHKALLHLRKRNRVRRERPNDRDWPGTSAQ